MSHTRTLNSIWGFSLNFSWKQKQYIFEMDSEENPIQNSLPELEDDTLDVILLGTGLTESVLAA